MSAMTKTLTESVFDAVKENDPATLKKLLEIESVARKVVNATDESGMTPLHYASMHGHTEIVAILLAKNATINVMRHGDWTPLILACRHGHKEIVAMLLNVDHTIINVPDDVGWTPLHHASNCGQTETVALLLKKNADVNALSKFGKTALEYATEQGHVDVIVLLKNNQQEEEKYFWIGCLE